MGGVWGTLSPKQGWNAQIGFPNVMRNCLLHIWVQLREKKMQALAESVAQMGYPTKFDPTPIVIPLTQCWHFHSRCCSQCAH